MSWDKNTINMSIINQIIGLLESLKTPYKVKTLKKIEGSGLNDGLDTFYELKKLEVKDFIYIDQMIKTTDCDTDDTIITHQFSKKEGIPKNFKILMTINNV